MARSDAVGKEPTIDEINATDMANFKGYSTTDGVVSKGEPTAEEKAALTRMNAKPAETANEDTPADETDSATIEETPEAKAAREAREAKMTEKQKAAAAQQTKVGGKDAKHRSADQRIGQAVAKQRATERELATEREERARERGAFEARLAALENRPLTTDGKPVKQVDKDAPSPKDYEFGELDAAYIRDLAVHETRKAIADDRTKQTAAELTAQQRREAQEFQAKAQTFEAAGLEKFDDFNEVVVEGARNGDWPLTKTFGDLMFESDFGPDIAYYLATHVEEAKKIMGKAPPAQAAAFGRLEATFSSTSSDATQQNNDQQPNVQGQRTNGQQAQRSAAGSTTRVPPPPEHQARGAGGKTKVGADTTDFAAFERLAQS